MVGRIDSMPEYEKTDKIYHWYGRIYANIVILDNPIDISEFNDFLLKVIVNKNFWRECPCHNKGNIYFVDNCIFINGKYVLLKVKLNITIDKNIKE